MGRSGVEWLLISIKETESVSYHKLPPTQTLPLSYGNSLESSIANLWSNSCGIQSKALELFFLFYFFIYFVLAFYSCYSCAEKMCMCLGRLNTN